MRSSFFAGSFLPGRESIFKYTHAGKVDGLPADRRAAAIGERASRLRSRNGKYRIGVQASLAAALLIVAVLFNTNFRPEAKFMVAVDEPEVSVMEEIEQTEQIEKPPPPPRPPVPVEVPNDEILEEEALALDAEIDFDEPLDLPPPPPAASEEAEPEIFVIVEEMPEMIGGIESLYETLEYPEVARLAGIEGNVVVQLLIDENGVPSNPVILRSAGQILNDAAKDALLKQRFTPGRQRGKAVRVQMAFPVRFKLG
jgi:protein TonB